MDRDFWDISQEELDGMSEEEFSVLKKQVSEEMADLEKRSAAWDESGYKIPPD